jgi:gluconate kinase
MLDAIIHVENDLVTYQQLKFLDSEDEAFSQTMSWTSGATHDTVRITLNGETATGQISDDKKRVSGGPVFGTFDWVEPEEAARIRQRRREAAAPLRVPSTLRPGHLGHITFICGPPGAGKSTMAGIIAKDKGWVYYEGDGFIWGFNPYMSPGESQVEARFERPALVGPGMRERGAALRDWLAQVWMPGAMVRAPSDRYFTMLAEDIARERQRVGGDWIVACVLPGRQDRDTLRRVLGEDLVIVVLDISLALVRERLAERELQGQMPPEIEETLSKNHGMFETAQDDEPNTVGFEIRRDANKEDNAKAVIELINRDILCGKDTKVAPSDQGFYDKTR